MLAEEAAQLIEHNQIHTIIQIDVSGARHVMVLLGSAARQQVAVED
jgi:hypothetical protein